MIESPPKAKPHTMRRHTLKVLTQADLPALHAAYDAVAAALPDPASFRLFGGPETFFHDHLGARGLSVGLFDETGLAAYGAITRPAYTDTDNYARDARWSEARAAHLVTLSAAFVHPRARGLGLHRQLIDARLGLLGEHDIDVLARAAPTNQVSRHNFFASGFALIWAGQQSEGSLRQVFWRSRDKPAVNAAWLHDFSPQWLHQNDLAGQQDLLAQGLVGVAHRDEEIGFVPKPAV